MAAITASMVAELRAKTDAPMMECKKALTEADGDMAKAEELLRVKLGNKANKASARITAIDVTWPGSGLKQHFADVPVNQAFSLEEGAATLTPIVRPTLTLGGAR